MRDVGCRDRRLCAAVHRRDSSSATASRFFREKESAVIARLLDGAPCILSTGGGAWLSEANRAFADRAGRWSCWLEADLDLLWSRVRHKSTRPLLRDVQSPADPERHSIAAREPVYALAPLRVHVDPQWSIEDTAGHVMAELARAGAVEGYGE